MQESFLNSELCQNTFSGHKGNNGNVSCLWLSRTVVFLSKLWEPILCVDKLPENTATDKLNTNMCEKGNYWRRFIATM